MTTIPSFTMNNGRTIPALGYGVFQMTSDEVRTHLRQAIDLGYRHIDTANAYFNEVAVGEVVREAIADGVVTREELFITSKLFPQSYPYAQCGADIDATLERLGLDYLDLLLFHQPYGEYVSGWRAMEEAVEAGKVRSIGLSNFNAAKVRQILDVATITPAVNQILINPRQNQHEIRTKLADTGIVYEGWYPLGHGDKTLLEEPAIVAAAERAGASPAQVVLAWEVAEGVVVFPKTLNPTHMAENLAALNVALTDEEIAAISAIEQAPYYEVPDEAPAFVLTHNDYSQQR
ncbi:MULTISPECIES: aldo/keto reductase [unclassified Actinomyces]|uniref:aldo/keto reductase n=1 Tax=unclassified Actinomyces TaxID=2609248 RepID=UPI0020176881|nr:MULTISPECIES: aldo/keto reductase [unclassified Actinomyces]MCL3777636.1 aldo/keto reductase [Actinomyces sp. AC-20-1]MCL3790019.1 aldo/keto reductase [Actinomyces sp. 187325]MCL3792416.1 aldo/keto reductase [Actinomyces sp. 186855]MCL3794839.1 aldo/keto reductase [Actinomyces sp. 217892]